ncbi:hypothetical protein SAMN06264364_11873 [Quadrisphaera granulorum]|uniref:Uncharacterized protein n=1 Tax=Quadrisphaera granulorum TaxID=317664 RepID=A0A316A5E5_9ACTN|nr:hypothetical protein [Quadrisphaera granulorum]PWJ52702.1 hypothetical protein BXY45_11873 [Quadrisphaera granulorum]SZE97524.1 hypothetical protein SAMN06264364_11873 [Quadrisphaera granulorum]
MSTHDSQSSHSAATPLGTGTDDDPTAGLPKVTEADIAAAMGVNSVPDEVRVVSDDPDETDQVMDATGRLSEPAEEEPQGHRAQ